METRPSDSTGGVDTPAWLDRLHPRRVGSTCWNHVRRFGDRRGTVAQAVALVVASVVAVGAGGVAALMYAIGYALTRPREAISGAD